MASPSCRQPPHGPHIVIRAFFVTLRDVGVPGRNPHLMLCHADLPKSRKPAQLVEGSTHLAARAAPRSPILAATSTKWRLPPEKPCGTHRSPLEQPSSVAPSPAAPRGMYLTTKYCERQPSKPLKLKKALNQHQSDACSEVIPRPCPALAPRCVVQGKGFSPFLPQGLRRPFVARSKICATGRQ